MTLIELMIALLVFSIVMAAGLNYLRVQSESYRLGSNRMDMLQNLEFAANVLSLDLRTAGSNTPDEQPFLIYCGSDVVAFNADYTTNVANDAWAVYYDRDAPTGSVTALVPARAITIPKTAFSYPQVAYSAVGGTGNSPAETIIFFFTLDSSTTRSDDYALFRQVNSDPPELVARNLVKTQGLPFFEYFWLKTPPSAPAYIEQVPASAIPLAHSVPIHGSSADTGAYARIDSVRAVQVNFTTTNGQEGAAERLRAVTRLIRMPNAGMAVRRTCGDEPLLGVSLTATGVTTALGEPAVNLSWGQAVDEAGGEADVTRYVVWRRASSNPDWGDPYLSIPSGQANYTYQDLQVASGDRYYYALAAQDCTPSLSSQALSALVIVP
jgi:type II secretory pathway pseudopilin PulG